MLGYSRSLCLVQRIQWLWVIHRAVVQRYTDLQLIGEASTLLEAHHRPAGGQLIHNLRALHGAGCKEDSSKAAVVVSTCFCTRVSNTYMLGICMQRQGYVVVPVGVGSHKQV